MPVEVTESALTEDQRQARRLLVERIVASQTFAKSERLISFLQCVCDLADQGDLDHIHEQYIGSAVFGRRPDYDPAVDSIVRSHASRLRHRLDRYFAEEGAEESMLLRIPKGGYTPIFEQRQSAAPETKIQPQEPPSFRLVDTRVLPLPTRRSMGEVLEDRSRRTIRRLLAALLAMTLAAAAALGYLGVQHRRASFRPESQRLFWSRLFNAGQSTVVVNADSGLVILQGLTRRRVTLDTYLNGDYLNNLPETVYSSHQTLDLARRRYTSIVDLRIQDKIFHLPGNDLEHTQFRYARDVRPEEIKRGNAILLGTYESTPWVQLFEPAMNFYFQNDLAAGIFSIINRSPRPGEERIYNSVYGDPEHTVYGVVAFRPSLSGSGNVLMLEGQSMAGTETAADFVFDDGYLLPFLHSIQRPDGSIPYFELVLRSRSLSGESSRLEQVASRIEDR